MFYQNSEHTVSLLLSESSLIHSRRPFANNLLNCLEWATLSQPLATNKLFDAEQVRIRWQVRCRCHKYFRVSRKFTTKDEIQYINLIFHFASTTRKFEHHEKKDETFLLAVRRCLCFAIANSGRLIVRERPSSHGAWNGGTSLANSDYRCVDCDKFFWREHRTVIIRRLIFHSTPLLLPFCFASTLHTKIFL